MLIIFGIIISNGPRNFIFCIVFFIFILYNRPKYALETGHRTMTYTELFIFILEIVGTIAFASSGAMTHYERLMSSLDAVGLGIFTVTGIRTAMALETSHINNIFLLVFVGATTGIGGGMMRDVMAGNTPFVFIKHVYACAALIGAFLYIFLYRLIPDTAAMLISSLTVVVIRLLAAHYRWNLPRIQK